MTAEELLKARMDATRRVHDIVYGREKGNLKEATRTMFALDSTEPTALFACLICGKMTTKSRGEWQHL